MIERLPIESREQWLAMRKADITASVVPALFGCHPYVTPLRLYAEHRGAEFYENDPENPVLRRGRWLEPAAALAVGERRPDWRIIKASEYYRDPDLRFGATPDYHLEDPRGRGVLQIKTVAPSVFRRDWDSGEACPFWVTLQTLSECILTNAAFGAVAVLLVDAHSMDLHIHEIPRHAAAEAKIIAAVKQFHEDVRLGIEPSADLAKDTEVIRALTPKETPGKSVDLSGNNYAAENLALRALLMTRIKSDQQRCDEIENELKILMGDGETATGLNGWKITFKSGERAGYVVKPRQTRTLRIYDRRPLEERPHGSDDDEF